MADTKNTEAYAVDVLQAAKDERLPVTEIIKYLGPEDKIDLKPFDAYGDNSEEFKDQYLATAAIKSALDNGYMIPERNIGINSMLDEKNGVNEDLIFQIAPIKAKQNYLMDDFRYGKSMIMSDKTFAENREYYGVIDEDEPLGVRYVPMEEGWEKLGKYVYAPDPRDGNNTKMLLQLPYDANTDGYEQLHTLYGSKGDFDRGILPVLWNAVSTVPRLAKGGVGIAKWLVDQASIISNQHNQIFFDQQMYDTYFSSLREVIKDDPDSQDLLDKALDKNNAKDILNTVNLIESRQPIWTRNRLRDLRYPDKWEKIQKALDSEWDALERWEQPIPEAANGGMFDNAYNFAYQASQGLSDLAVQTSSSFIPGALPAKIAMIAVAESQILGETMSQLKDANFSREQLGWASVIVATALPVSEVITNFRWMRFGMPDDVLKKYGAIVGEEAKKAYAKAGGEMTNQIAGKVSTNSLKRFFKNPALHDWIDSHYLGVAGKAMSYEMIQEPTEDVGYNIAKLITNLQRPEYYDDEIDTGINDLFGDDGVFNGRQIFETMVMTGFVTGINHVSMTGIREGKKGFKDETMHSRQRLAQQLWAAEQASKGKMDMFLDFASKESKKDINAFGAKSDKLTDFGADNIVIPANEASVWSKYFTPDAQTGDITIDNIADAHLFNFVQQAEAMKRIAADNEIDGQSVNAKMLNEIQDINGKLLSVQAIENAIAVKEALATYNELNNKNTDDLDNDQKEKHQAKLEIAQEEYEKAKEILNYFIKPEKGSSFSEAVNDQVKLYVSTYQAAEQKAKETLGNNFDLSKKNNKKTFDAIKGYWQKMIYNVENYEALKEIYKNISLFVEREEATREAKLKEAQDVEKGMESIVIEDNSINNIAKEIEGILSKNDVDFVKELSNVQKKINELFNGKNGIINKFNRLDINRKNVDMLLEKFSQMYSQAYNRLSSVDGNIQKANEIKSSLFGNVDDAIQEGLEFEQIEGYEEFIAGKSKTAIKKAKKNYEELLELSENNALEEDLNAVDMSEMPGFSSNKLITVNDFNREIRKKIDRYSKEFNISTVYDLWISEVEDAYKDAATMSDPGVSGLNNQFYGYQPSSVMEQLDRSYSKIIDILEKANEIAKRIDDKPLFKKHSNIDEQQVVKKFVGDDFEQRVKNIKSDYETFKNKSGLSEAQSINPQKHKRTLLINNQVTAIKYLNSLGITINGAPLISKAHMDELEKFVVNELLFKVENGITIERRGRYTPEQEKLLLSTEKIIYDIITEVQKNKATAFAGVNMEKILEPIKNYVEKSNGTRFTSALGYDGSYQSEQGVRIFEVDDFRQALRHYSISDIMKMDIGPNNKRKEAMEMLFAYTNLLMVMGSNVSIDKINAYRKNNKNIITSTYEQELVENSLVSFFSGSTIAKKIVDYEQYIVNKHNEGKEKKHHWNKTENIGNLFVIPGDYGTGKTEIVVKNAIAIAKANDVNPKYQFFAPSSRLLSKLASVFGDGVVATNYHDTNDLIKYKANPGEVLVIDEGSLLEADHVKAIETIAKNNPSVKIIIMADMNQMLGSSPGMLPLIMTKGFKTQMLSEQFSNASPIIQRLANVWRGLIARTRAINEFFFTGHPDAYFEIVDGVKTGTHYSSMMEESWNSFVASQTSNKAFIFFNQKEHDDFLKGKDIKGLEDKIFIITPTVDSKKLIQGLRESEVYIGSNPINLIDNNVSTKDRVLRGIYTAIGRAAKFVDMNIGVNAENYNKTSIRDKSIIGDTSSNNTGLLKKIVNMNEFNKNRYDYLSKKGATTTKNEKTNQSEPIDKELKKAEEEVQVKKEDTTVVPIFHLNGKVDITAIHDKEKNAYNFFLNNILISSVISHDDQDLDWIESTARDLYADYRESHAEIPEIYDTVINSYGLEISIGDFHTINGEIIEIKKTDEVIFAVFPNKEVLRVNDIKQEDMVAVDDDNISNGIRVRKSQARAWVNEAIWSTSYFIANGDNYNDLEKAQIRSMHSFLMSNLDRNLLRLVYHSKIKAIDEKGKSDEYEDVLIVEIDYINKYDDIRKFVDRYSSIVLPGTHVYDVLQQLSKLKNKQEFLDQFSKYYQLSALATPLITPAMDGVVAKNQKIAISRDIDVNQIIDSYAVHIARLSGDEQKALIAQRDAQIRIAELRNLGKENAVDGKYNFIGSIAIPETFVHVVYDNNKPMRFYDTIELDHKMVSIDNTSTFVDQDGRLILRGTFDALKTTEKFTVIVRMPFIKDVRKQLDEEYQKDKEILDQIPTTKSEKESNPEAYSIAMKLFRSTNLYQIIMNNRKNIIKNIKYEEYFEFVKDDKYVNPVGKTLVEQRDNLLKLLEMVYNDKIWTTRLYDSFKRDFATNTVVLRPGQRVLTYATAIHNPQYYVSVKNLKADDASPLSQNVDKENPVDFQQPMDDSYDQEYRNREKSRFIIDTILGTQQKNHFTDGLINYNGVVATGMALNGEIWMADINGVRRSTPYHESIHIVWNNVLNPLKRMAYEHLARKIAFRETGENLSGKALEEWLATDFGKVSISKELSGNFDDKIITWDFNVSDSELTLWQRFKKWFKGIVDFIHGERNALDNFYEQLLLGKYAKSKHHTSKYARYEGENESFSPDEQKQGDPNELYEQEKQQDKITKYLALKTILPSESGLLRKIENTMRFMLFADSDLGNKLNSHSVSLIQSIKDYKQIALDKEKSLENIEVNVTTTNGVVTKAIKDVLPSEYQDVLAISDKSMEENKRQAQGYYKTWLAYKKENVDTILEHIIPEYDAEAFELENRSTDGFTWDKMDPEADGYTAQMKLLLSSIPVMRQSGNIHKYNSNNIKFVDFKTLSNLIKIVGLNANVIYNQAKTKHDNVSIFMAFEMALDEEITKYGTDTYTNGEYINKYTEALVAFRNRFIKGEFSNEANEGSQYSLLDISNRLYERSKEQFNPSEYARMNNINMFLCAMVGLETSYVIANNMKQTVKGNPAYSGFKYHITEHSNNIFDDHKNQMKDRLDTKLSSGRFTGHRQVTTFNNRINVSLFGDISLGKGKIGAMRPVSFIKRNEKTGMYEFTDMGDRVNDRRSMSDKINDVLRHFSLIRGTIGITEDILPSIIIRKCLESKWEDMQFMTEQAETKSKKQANKVYKTPGDFLTAYLANTIYSYASQLQNAKVEFSFDHITDEGVQKKKYNRINNINDHIDDINKLLAQGKIENIKIGDKEIALKDLFETISKSPTFSLNNFMREYITNTGDDSIFKKSNSSPNESLTGLGLHWPIASQMYTSISMLSAAAVSHFGATAGGYIVRADGKKVHTLQMKNMFNDITQGSKEIIDNLIQELDGKDVSGLPIFSNTGEPLMPYMRKAKNMNTGIYLDHMDDSYGVERDYGSFIRGKKSVNTLDLITFSINAFFSNAMAGKKIQHVVIPISTIGDTGHVYYTYNSFTEDLLNTYDEYLSLDHDVAFNHIALQAQKIERHIELSRRSFYSLIDDINKKYGVSIGLPSNKRSNKSSVITEKDYIKNSKRYIDAALDQLTEEVRNEVLDYVFGSDLDKNADIKISKDRRSFSMGAVASDNIPNLTEPGTIYNELNRELIKKADKKSDKKKIIESLFFEDYMAFADYIAEHGFSDENDDMWDSIKAISGKNSIKGAYTKTNVNEPLFAFYMAYHIVNNAFDDINGSVMSYKNIFDKVKRTGAQNTPKIRLVTDPRIGGRFIGGVASSSPVVTIFDLKDKVNLMGQDIDVNKATDGESIMHPQYHIGYKISMGGEEYSITGDGKMLKTLLVQRDIAHNDTKLLKHASKVITDSEFEGHVAYRNMVMDGYDIMDDVLSKSGFRVLAKNTPYEGFSWKEAFIKYMNENNASMSETVEYLHSVMVQSQDISDELYHALSGSVLYGYNTLNTRKNSVRQINDYEPRQEVYKRPLKFAIEMMDNGQYGTILNSEQSIDDKKKQTPAQQIDSMIGISNVMINGVNAGFAINNIRNNIMRAAWTNMQNEISKIQPEGDVPIGIPFNQINWSQDLGETADYAIAQYEWYMRNRAKNGLSASNVPGNFVELLSSKGVTREIPQMRKKMIESIRNDMNRKLVKPGTTGMRTVQATGILHDVYELPGDNAPFTYVECLEYLGIDKKGYDRYSKETEEKVLATFTRRRLKDMRVENGETVHGEVIMPYIFAKKLGLRRKGEEGAMRDESIRDLFTITVNGIKKNIRGKNIKEQLGEEFIPDNLFFDSVLVRKALRNLSKRKKQKRSEIIDYYRISSNIDELLSEVEKIYEAIENTLVVFANRVPSNFLGSGAFFDIVGFHSDGNEIYIPIGMTIVNDSDFDIDQLTAYFKSMSSQGFLSEDEIARFQNDILDIMHAVYMSKDSQEDIFLKSTLDMFMKVADEDTGTTILNSNTPFSGFKTYNDGKAGADGIGIGANTLNTVSWLQTIADNINQKGMDENILKILSDRNIRGIGSTCRRLGLVLQATLDNNTYNFLGKFGITPESVPIFMSLIAIGPDEGVKDEEFLRELKQLFTDPYISSILNESSKASSIHYKTREYNLYKNIEREIRRLRSQKYIFKLESETEARIAYANHIIENILPVLNADKEIKYNVTVNSNGYMDLGDSYGTYTVKTQFMNEVRNYIASLPVTDEIRRKFHIYGSEIKKFTSKDNEERFLYHLTVLQKGAHLANALRGFSTILALRDGIPAVDWDFYNKQYYIEQALGMSINDYMAMDVEEINDDDAKRRYMQHYIDTNEEYNSETDEMEKELLLKIAEDTFNQFNVAYIIKNIPTLNSLLEMMALDKAMNSATFMDDNKAIDDLASQFQKRIGTMRFNFSSQRNIFMNTLHEWVLDKYFDAKDNIEHRRIFIGMPNEFATGYAYGNNMFSNMNLSDVYKRQEFSLHMPLFVDRMKDQFDSKQDMENYYAAYFPKGHTNEYAGISDAFYDKNGNYIGNEFIRSLGPVGTGDRKYVGLTYKSNTMTEETRAMLVDDFNKLPEAMRELFVYNEIINNALNYRHGSITDIIGITPFKESGGISDIYNNFSKSVRNGIADIVADPVSREKFMDYMAIKSEMPAFVKKERWQNPENPMYIRSNYYIGEKRTSLTITYKKNADDNLYYPINLITNRAGISKKQPVIVSTPDISLTSQEQQDLNEKGSTTKQYPTGHGYKNGIYVTDDGVYVQLTALSKNISINLKKIDYDDNIERIKEEILKNVTTENNAVIISRVGRNENGIYMHRAVPGKEDLFNALSFYGHRPFKVDKDVFQDISTDMEFNNVKEAIIYFKYLLFQRYLPNSVKIQELTLDTEKERDHGFNSLNDAINRYVNDNMKKDNVILANHRININLRAMAPIIIAQSFRHNYGEYDILENNKKKVITENIKSYVPGLKYDNALKEVPNNMYTSNFKLLYINDITEKDQINGLERKEIMTEILKTQQLFDDGVIQERDYNESMAVLNRKLNNC